MQACKLGDKGTAQKLLESNSLEDRTTWLQYRDDHHNTLLHLAAYSGDKDTVQYLLDNSVPFQENKSFDTPLDVAVMKGHEEMVSLLLNANADQSYFNPGCMTILYLAAQNRNTTIADALLAKTPHEKVNAINIWLSTPLHLAAEGGYLDIVEALLKASADTTARNVWCRTPSIWPERMHIPKSDERLAQYIRGMRCQSRIQRQNLGGETTICTSQ